MITENDETVDDKLSRLSWLPATCVQRRIEDGYHSQFFFFQLSTIKTGIMSHQAAYPLVHIADLSFCILNWNAWNISLQSSRISASYDFYRIFIECTIFFPLISFYFSSASERYYTRIKSLVGSLWQCQDCSQQQLE